MTDTVVRPRRVPKRFLSILTVIAVLLAVVVLADVGSPVAVSAVPPGNDSGPGSGGDGSGGTPEPGGNGDPGSAVPADAQKGYYVLVELERQVVLVYLDGKEIRSMVCSGGTTEKPTPTGRFDIQNRGEFFFSEKYQQGGKWWVSFRDWGIYLFHSVPANRNGEIIPKEAAKLGQPASHGCVRLAMDDARWFYDTIPEGTPVDIR